MKKLYTPEYFNSAKKTDLLCCECYSCSKPFYVLKKVIIRSLKPNNSNKVKFCSQKCNCSNRKTKINLNCTNCNKQFEKFPNQINKSKSGNHFCCKSCAISYNNKNKTTGNRRSKLEIYLENKLTELYPTIEFHFNRKDTIGSELDIYIPSLKLAFELNGIFHYEPIYGNNKLLQIQNNDNNKFQKCLEHNISLCIIDTSSQKYFKEQTSKKFLDIICQILSQHLNAVQ